MKSRRSGAHLTLAFEAADSFRRPLQYAHEGVEFPLARKRPPDKATEHDLGPASFVRRIVRGLEKVRQGGVEGLLLRARRLPGSSSRGVDREKLVQREGHRMREIEDRIGLRGRDRDQ